MAGVLRDGQLHWSMVRDEDGHRDYTIVWEVITTSALDGPATVIQTPTLPQTGDQWNFDNDIDIWAFCWPDWKVTLKDELKGEPQRVWEVEQHFTTRPLKRCQDVNIEDPLLEPPQISGSFVKYTQEAVYDRFGDAILNSSHELFRGPQVEFDHNRPSIKISHNVLNLQLPVFTQMVDTVNDATLWGLPTRTIKLSNVSWERKYFGICSIYYSRAYEFDIDFNTFDRCVLDEGTKVLHGSMINGVWTVTNYPDGTVPNANNPSHFARYKDQNGENLRAILDGAGLPITDYNLPGQICFEYYPESNFLTLGIPASL